MPASQTTKYIVKTLFTLCLIGGAVFMIYVSATRSPAHPLTRQPAPEIIEYNDSFTQTFEMSPTAPEPDELLSYIPDFVETPQGGTAWEVFGQTKQNSYSFTAEDGLEWEGVRPEFSDDLKQLDGTDILIQGYMFPLDNTEQQSMFLLGPFPMSCPFHYHVTPNLIIEVHMKNPMPFSYDPVNISGTLELVPKDDEYNVFYRLNNAEVVN